MRDRQLLAVERWYLRRLLSIVRYIRSLAGSTSESGVDVFVSTLLAYSEILRPWARTVSRNMLEEVSRREAQATASERPKYARRQSNRMYELLRRQLTETEVGERFRALQEAQVDLIVSLPRDVAEKVQKIASNAALAGWTPKQTIAAIVAASGTSEPRARLIARTETSRAFADLTRARAEFAGSTHYVWRSAKDQDVRPTHRALNGHTFAWNDPPVAEADGTRHGPGQGYNCFVGSTPVRIPSDIRAVIRSEYQGRLVSITAGGSTIQVTPNHPILTGRGWRLAGDLQEGDEVFKTPIGGSFRGESNEHEVLPTIEEVFIAIGAAGGNRIRSELDLYRRIAESEIREIRSDRVLSLKFDSENEKRGCDLVFADANAGVFDPVFGAQSDVFEPLFSTRLDEEFAVFRAGLGHAEDHAVGSVSRFDAGRSEAVTYGPTGDPEVFSKAFNARSAIEKPNERVNGDIVSSVWGGTPNTRHDDPEVSDFSTEDVRVAIQGTSRLNDGTPIRDGTSSGLNFFSRKSSVGSERVSRVQFSEETVCHVFTLVTGKGWYTVSSTGIVVKNCRCVALPIFPDED